TATVDGQGSITISPGESTYSSEQIVELTAVPDYGWSFTGWSGDLVSTDNPEMITMNNNKTISATFTMSEPDGWWNTNWQYRKEIIIDHTLVAADFTNIPLLITTDSDSNLAQYAQATGMDLVFTDRYGNKLNHEIESYENSTGYLVSWVNIPVLSDTEDTILYMYYGNPDADNQANHLSVWNGDYKLVLHLNENYEAVHECRMWGIVADTLPATTVMDHLVNLPYSLKNLSPSNPDGWGLVYYEGLEPTDLRGIPAAYNDPNFNVAAQEVADSGEQIALGHVRKRSSGATGIPDPHPFIRYKLEKYWSFAHNGGLDKNNLKLLIGWDYLNANPPIIGTNWNDTNVIDSDLYMLYVLKCIEDNGGDALAGITIALTTILQTNPTGAANFLFTDGTTMWAFCKGRTLCYEYQEGSYTAIASQHPGSTQGSWVSLSDYNLIIVTVDNPPTIITDITDYVPIKHCYDSTVNSNHGVLHNGVVQGITGYIDGAHQFDGVDDYIEILHSSTISGFTTSFTTSFWLKLDDTTKQQTILNKYNTTSNQRGWCIDYQPSTGLVFTASPDGINDNVWSTAFTPTVATWYHITVNWEPGTVPQFYIDGIQTPTTGANVITQIYNNINTPLLIGKYPNDNRYFLGCLDEIRISSPSRSPEWILTRYHNEENPTSFVLFNPQQKITYTITASAGVGGSITPSDSVIVNRGADQEFLITAYSGYHIDEVFVDGSSVGSVSSYTFTEVVADHTIVAYFESDIVSYTIVASAGAGGSISPSGDVVVVEGSYQNFTITPTTGYLIDVVLVDDESKGPITWYNFSNVIADHTIEASFALNPLLVDSMFDTSVDSADLRANSTSQDWYESRNNVPTQLTLDESNIGGNVGKKAMFTGSTAGNAYMSQEFSSAQSGQVSVVWDVYVVEIVPTYNSAWMFIGDNSVNTGSDAGKGPCSTAAERFARLSFTNDGSGGMNLIGRSGSTTDVTIMTGLSLNTWYTLKVVADLDTDTYDVYVDGLYQTTLNAHTPKSSVTHVSFATWNDGPGTFYIDNVYSPPII
ncbi:MAG: DUF2341 domain-containing protein, partial [Thermoplasmata archaeon]|nr:DUF2341 domain-containing protein [Thermoplasmata archaeon]